MDIKNYNINIQHAFDNKYRSQMKLMKHLSYLNDNGLLSKEEKLAVCCIINSEAKWYFHQLLDNDGNGTDDIYEFLNDCDDIVQFNVHRTSDDEIRCYLSSDFDNDEVLV